MLWWRAHQNLYTSHNWRWQATRPIQREKAFSSIIAKKADNSDGHESIVMHSLPCPSSDKHLALQLCSSSWLQYQHSWTLQKWTSVKVVHFFLQLMCKDSGCGAIPHCSISSFSTARNADDAAKFWRCKKWVIQLLPYSFINTCGKRNQYHQDKRWTNPSSWGKSSSHLYLNQSSSIFCHNNTPP